MKKSLLDHIPTALPPFERSHQIQATAAEAGLDWENTEQVLRALEEEVNELKLAFEQKNHKEIISELGDVIFTCINLARHLDTRAEIALDFTNRKFVKRFQFIEAKLQQKKQLFSELTFSELLMYWNLAKKEESMISNDLAVIDMELGARLAGNNKQMARELMNMLMEAFPVHMAELTVAHNSLNFDNLAKAAHKLHGALCYTGTPRLKEACKLLEETAKNKNKDNVHLHFRNLITEIESVQNEWY